MSNFANWVSPELLRTLGWTLLHFLWQGAGLAGLFAAAVAVCRSAPARYALALRLYAAVDARTTAVRPKVSGTVEGTTTRSAAA